MHLCLQQRIGASSLKRRPHVTCLPTLLLESSIPFTSSFTPKLCFSPRLRAAVMLPNPLASVKVLSLICDEFLQPRREPEEPTTSEDFRVKWGRCGLAIGFDPGIHVALTTRENHTSLTSDWRPWSHVKLVKMLAPLVPQTSGSRQKGVKGWEAKGARTWFSRPHHWCLNEATEQKGSAQRKATRNPLCAYETPRITPSQKKAAS